MEREGHTPEHPALSEPLPVNFEHIPKQLRDCDHFVVWKYAIIDDEIKKPPLSPKTGRAASVRNPATWGSFQEAQSAYETGKFAGVGIVLTSNMGIVALDIDHCIIDGQVSDDAQRMIHVLQSYTEISPSGTGIRLLLEGKLLGGLRRRGTVEMYEDLRYVTLTGHRLAHTPEEIQPRHRELYELYHRVFALGSRTRLGDNTGGGVKDGGRPTTVYQVARSDQQVVQKALSAKNGETFRRYYYGDASLWEGAGAKHASQSEVDFTLVLMLLYWTNNDTSQVDRLFRQSGLMREKWHRPIKGSETYGDRLIHDAIRKGRH
jgi:putative DNA primase/helicase